MSIVKNPNEKEPEFIGFVEIRAGSWGTGDFRFVAKGETRKEVSDHLHNMVFDAVNNAREYSDSEDMTNVVSLEEDTNPVQAELPTDFGE